MVSGLLRQKQDTGKYESSQNAGGTIATERKSAVVNRLVEQIAQGGAERSREDKRGPEEHSARNACKEICSGCQRQPCTEYEGPAFIAKPIRVGHPVAERRS